MKIVLLDAKTIGDDIDLSALYDLGEFIQHEVSSPNETLSRVAGCEVVITNKVVIDREVMEQTPSLKLICVAATGMNNIDLEAAKALGIEVKNVAGYSTQSVVQHTFAMLFYLIEKMPYYDNFVKSGAWSCSPIFTDVSHPYFEVAGKSWGIIGLGSIGKGVAKVATGFGAEVSYYSTSGKNNDGVYAQKSLESLLRESDILSIHAPLNDATHNLIDAEQLAQLKEHAVLLNLGRGGIVNEKALADVLNSREIYVGLDVIEKEPIAMENPLMQCNQERLLITPHIAWASREARVTLVEGIVENIESYVEL
jgi:lactate dehydrogenase-like 2-hydroxyacid dehydrogenase